MIASLLNSDTVAKKLVVEVSLKGNHYSNIELNIYRASFYSDYIFDC